MSGLLTGAAAESQQAVVTRAVELGVNWFDTAATYGNGQSETSLGAVLPRLQAEHEIHIATKVRVNLADQTDLRPLVLESVNQSLRRLNVPRVTVLQLHNSVTRNREDQPTSITPEDVLGPRGILAGMEAARDAGLVDHFGLTGIGDAESLFTVMQSKKFATIQAPFHVLNPSALRVTPASLCDPDFGGFLRTAHELGMGLFAIRVFAAGALLGAAPSAHTYKTPFFPLDLYQRDEARARQLSARLGSNAKLRELALRYVISQLEIASAIVGFGDVSHVDDAVRVADEKLLSAADVSDFESLRDAAMGNSVS